MNKKIEEKYIATMLLHALGDTIGFKNGEWEFLSSSKSSYNATLDKLYKFIDLGGITGIELKNWFVSDDTILHMAIAISLISSKNKDEFNASVANQFIKATELMYENKKNGLDRYIGNTTAKYINLLKNGKDWKTFPFDEFGGGNGVAMRNNCIGLAFFGEENRDKLIGYSIDSGKMTHPNPIGWLGGLSTALFTAFALEDKNINKWVPEMLQIMESNKIKKYITTNDELHAFEQFVQCWKTYYETRFLNGKPIKIKSHMDLVHRLIFYNNIFDINPNSSMGRSGYSAVIVAYDCLIDAGNNWEKLVIYSMINIFDSDTIGAIAAGLYGTLYGFANVPENNLKYLEFKNKLIKIGKLLYEKFYEQKEIHV